MMSEHGINHLTDFALFLPFSCIERRQTAASQCKATTLEVIEEIKKTVKYGEFAKTCKRVQNGPSQGSGPGGRWFESTRPDQFHQLLASKAIRFLRTKSTFLGGQLGGLFINR